MKKRLQAVSAFVLLLGCMGIVSCSSDDSNTPSNPGPVVEEIKVPSTVEFSDMRKRVLEEEKQEIRTVLNEEMGFTFTSKKGVNVVVSSLGLQQEGFQVGEEVTCTFVELYDKGVMALANRPTMGIYPNRDEWGYFDYEKDNYGRIEVEGYRGFIITGGEFYFDIKVKGKRVSHYSIGMEVPAANTRGYQSDMILWQGNVNEKDDLTFTEIPMQTEMGFMGYDENSDNYVLNLNGWSELPSEIGWTNIDKYAYEEGEKTQFFVKAPQGYNYENAAVYLGVKGDEGLAHLDVFLIHPELGGVFTEHFGWVPVGLEGYVFFISVDGNTQKVVYAIKEIAVEKNQVIEIKAEDLKMGTTEEVIAILNALK